MAARRESNRNKEVSMCHNEEGDILEYQPTDEPEPEERWDSVND
jgi:hypothetical protein